jgi:hypothetical protein
MYYDGWFGDVFLASIFDRAGTSKNLWLSRKQTNICVENMAKHTIRLAQFQGDYACRDYYTCAWRGREVTLQYIKLNGCGIIEFGMTDIEMAVANKERNIEKLRIEMERVARIKSRPGRLAKEIKKAKDDVQSFEEELEGLEEELIHPIEGITRNDTLADIKKVKEALIQARFELAKWMN